MEKYEKGQKILYNFGNKDDYRQVTLLAIEGDLARFEGITGLWPLWPEFIGSEVEGRKFSGFKGNLVFPNFEYLYTKN
jgi:hypothetical protein